MALGGNININIQANFAQGTQARLQSQLDAIGRRLTLNIGQVKITNQQFNQQMRDAANKMGQAIRDANNQAGNNSGANNLTAANERAINSMNRLVQAYRSGRIDVQRFMEQANRNLSGGDLPIQNRIRLLNQLQAAERQVIRAQNETNRINNNLRYNPQTEASVQARAQSQLSSAQGRLNAMSGSNLVDQTRVQALRAEFDRLGTSIRNIGNARMSQQWNTEFTRANTQLRELNRGFQEARRSSGGFFSELADSAKKMMYWSVVGGALFGTFNQIKEGIKYIYDLDNALNQIRIVTERSQADVEKLAVSYNNLAKQMGVTTKEVASTAVDLYRQGLNDDQVQERMKGIIQYAKISSLSLEDSNKIITATANATGEGITKITDLFAKLGDMTSAGADEIGKAFQKVASTAKESGVSIEKTAAWIATISSKTREAPETIGNSLEFGALAA